ncbi:hypothetical protein ACFQH2_08710 [Natronoarchaeum sp. GCM10025703]|uniref:hypothetical protein n=1 Tax=unclassified Natronoarchaeum TaxID=2620183 RepID=UPI0036222411
MHRRRLLALSGALFAVPLAGCSSSDDGDEQAPEPVVESVRYPDPYLPERDVLDVTPVPEDSTPITERVGNAGNTGEVDVALTLLESAEDETDGGTVYTGSTDRVRRITIDEAGIGEVSFEGIATGYDTYWIDARPASLTATVTNESEDGRVVVSVSSPDGSSVHAEERIDLAAGDTTELTFRGYYVAMSADDLVVEASAA